MISINKITENNLKNISVSIPIYSITTVVGRSGSGKSSLIYKVLAKESIRRERIDSGVATCLEYAIRPNFESAFNLPYPVVLQQKSLTKAISSTVGTLTGLLELLRDLYLQHGTIVAENGNIVTQATAAEIVEYLEKYYSEEQFEYYAVVCFEKHTDGSKELAFLKRNNVSEAIFISSYDEKVTLKKISSIKKLNEKYEHTILIKISNNTDLIKNENIALESFLVTNAKYKFNFNYDYPDIKTGIIYQKITRPLLSFNSTGEFSGKCTCCNGYGKIETILEDLLFCKKLNLNENFLNIPLNKEGRYENIILFPASISNALKKEKIRLDQTYWQLNAESKKIIHEIVYNKIFTHRKKAQLEKFISTVQCPRCNGTRFSYKANAVKLYGKSIAELLDFTPKELYGFMRNNKIENSNISHLLEALNESTLGYLSLNRTTDTLSGGELQRLKLAIELTSEYKGLLYILDEPSSGLHPYNNLQIIGLINRLKHKGNTIVISEHNADYIQNSDYVIELGPGSGKNGGYIISAGLPQSGTMSEYNREKKTISHGKCISLKNVHYNNIKNESFIIPLHCLVTISGISGSGKSTLVHQVVVPSLKQYLLDKTYNDSVVKELVGGELISGIGEFTQSQIGNNSRSIVATYLDLFDIIRDVFASLESSGNNRFDKSYFSFNSENGACEVCKGLGEVDNLICSNCVGKRYKSEILEVYYKGYNIVELLDLELGELKTLLAERKIQNAIETLEKLGLSHLSLGRTTQSLSGGESQRLKLTQCLLKNNVKIKEGNFLLVLDEPTRGLNDKDIVRFFKVIDEIISFNNSVIIIEHNLNIIKNSDYVIDIGIGSGNEGGKNIYSGLPDGLVDCPNSLTAKSLNGEKYVSQPSALFNKELKEKKYINNNVAKCHPFYLNDEHFKLEQEFAQNYIFKTDSENHLFFTSKESLSSFVESLKNPIISFNPYTSDLFKYKKVPLSIRQLKNKSLMKMGFSINKNEVFLDEWSYRVRCDSLDYALALGSGWVTVVSDDKRIYELFTRFVSIDNKVIGSTCINKFTFSAYVNSCLYCAGTSTKKIYDNSLIINDESKSILDTGFFKKDIKLNLKKKIDKFYYEGLFDFRKPFHLMEEDEKLVCLYGFKEYKFLKAKGKPNIQSDYIEWKGIYSEIYRNLHKIKHRESLQSSVREVTCPFCINGFKDEVKYYLYKGKNIHEYIDNFLHKLQI